MAKKNLLKMTDQALLREHQGLVTMLKRMEADRGILMEELLDLENKLGDWYGYYSDAVWELNERGIPTQERKFGKFA
jgi:hypothetical protein